MPIKLKNPIKKPASEEQVFDALWILEMIIQSKTHESAMFYLTTAPYSTSTGDILTAEKKSSHCELFDAVENVPEAMNAYLAIIAAIPAILDYIDDKHHSESEI